MFSRAIAATRSASDKARMYASLGFGLVAGGALLTPDHTKSESTREAVDETLRILKKIESDLGLAETDAPRFTAADSYPTFTDDHISLVKKYLTRDMYNQLGDKVTKHGFTLDQAIQTSIDLPYAKKVHVGLVAGDEESYETFAPLFDAVIEDYHGHKKSDSHVTNLNPEDLKVPNFDTSYVLSTRIRAGRSVAGLSLPPNASRAERRETERLIVEGLNSLEGELKGKYYPLLGMTKEDNERLINDHFLFENPDAWTIAGGFGRDWPESRGIFHNDAKTFLVWVNEEDHMRIISMQKGADVKAVFTRFSNACKAVEESLKRNGAQFAHNDHLGYITTCPTNLGTGLRASVHAKFPLLGRKDGFKQYCQKLGLQVRGRGGEKDHSFTGVFDISNLHRLGHSEVELIQGLLNGLDHLIGLEKKLEAGEKVDLQ